MLGPLGPGNSHQWRQTNGMSGKALVELAKGWSLGLGQGMGALQSSLPFVFCDAPARSQHTTNTRDQDVYSEI